MGGTKYRAGIVGLRGIASRRAGEEAGSPLKREIIISHAASIALTSDIEVVGFCDRVPELRDEFQAAWGDRFPNATPYDDYNEMLAREELHILTIATGDNTHAPIAVAGANAGVRGIFCEKPLATSMEDAKRMIAACEENGVVLMVDHTRRWNPYYHAAREAIREGAIGELATIVATLGGPRALLFRNGTHLIDAICFFAESDPVQVFARLEDGFDHWDEFTGVESQEVV